MASKKTTQQMVLENGNQLANEAGYDSAGEYIENLRDGINSPNKARSMDASRAAGDFTSKLTLLTLYQAIDGEFNLGVYDWVNKFEMSKISAGNSKQFIRNILTGADNYDENTFNPTTATKPQVDTYTISLYSANTTSSQPATLSTYAKKIVKPLTILKAEWMPYFISGKLQEFVNKISQQINESVSLIKFELFQQMVNKIKTGYNSSNQQEGMKKVFDESGRTGAVNISSQVTNILDVFTKIVFPNITNMAFLNSEYNISLRGQESTSLNSCNRDDILILVNNKTYTKLTSGVLANVFNNRLASVEKYINPDNIIPCGRKITTSNSSTAIGVHGSEDLIAENEVVVINKNVFKSLLFVDEAGSQSYVTNMSIQLVAHLWIACGIIPWGQGFVVRTDKLTVMPTV